MKIEDFQIAFLVHFSEMFNHYSPVWGHWREVERRAGDDWLSGP